MRANILLNVNVILTDGIRTFLNTLTNKIVANQLQIAIFFFNDTATTEIYTLSLHDALPICSFCIRRYSPCCKPVKPGHYGVLRPRILLVLLTLYGKMT